jgi:hypothetical protein
MLEGAQYLKVEKVDTGNHSIAPARTWLQKKKQKTNESTAGQSDQTVAYSLFIFYLNKNGKCLHADQFALPPMELPR